MLAGFEEQTKELSRSELDAAPALLEYLREAVGKAKAVTNKKIRAHLISMGHKLSESRVRKVINFFRREFAEMGALVASSKGYWLSKDPAEVRNYLSSLTGRINEIRRVRYHTEKYYLKISDEPQNTIKEGEGSSEENANQAKWTETKAGKRITQIIRSYPKTLFD
jgi:predicted metal-dependent hydrolase